MKSDKQIKKDLYEELVNLTGPGHTSYDIRHELEKKDLVALTFDDEDECEAYEKATWEERLNRSFSYWWKIMPQNLLTLNQIKNGLEIISPDDKFFIYDYHNQISFYSIFQSYKADQYTKYKNDLKKMEIPFIHCNSKDKTVKYLGTFKNLQALRDHLLDELNVSAGYEWDKEKQEWFSKEDPTGVTKAEDIQLIVKKDKNEEIKEMAFVSTKWNNHHFWLIHNSETIQNLTKIAYRTGYYKPSKLKINEDIQIPNDWRTYGTSSLSQKQQQKIKEFDKLKENPFKTFWFSRLKTKKLNRKTKAIAKQKPKENQKTKDDEEMETE